MIYVLRSSLLLPGVKWIVGARMKVAIAVVPEKDEGAQISVTAVGMGLWSGWI